MSTENSKKMWCFFCRIEVLWYKIKIIVSIKVSTKKRVNNGNLLFLKKYQLRLKTWLIIICGW